MAIVVEKWKEERLKLSQRSLIAHGNNKQHRCQYCIIEGMKNKQHENVMIMICTYVTMEKMTIFLTIIRSMLS